MKVIKCDNCGNVCENDKTSIQQRLDFSKATIKYCYVADFCSQSCLMLFNEQKLEKVFGDFHNNVEKANQLPHNQ